MNNSEKRKQLRIGARSQLICAATWDEKPHVPRACPIRKGYVGDPPPPYASLRES